MKPYNVKLDRRLFPGSQDEWDALLKSLPKNVREPLEWEERVSPDEAVNIALAILEVLPDDDTSDMTKKTKLYLRLLLKGVYRSLH